MAQLVITKEQDKAHKDKLQLKFDKEVYNDVQVIWAEIDRLKKELNKSYEDMPMNTSLDYYNKRRSFYEHKIQVKMDELEAVEALVQAEKTKYSANDFI